MKKLKPDYKTVLKEQILVLLIVFGLFVALGISMYPVNTLENRAVFSALSISMFLLSFLYVRRLSTRVVCANCEASLYEVSEHLKSVKKSINYCPVCGHKVNT